MYKDNITGLDECRQLIRTKQKGGPRGVAPCRPRWSADRRVPRAVVREPGGLVRQSFGQLFSTLRDQRKNKDILKVNVPVEADVRVGPIVVPLPPIK